MKRLISLLLIISALLCSCTSDEPKESDAGSSSAAETDVQQENSEITIDELASYTIIRSEHASKELVSATVPFAAKMREISPKMGFTDDFIKEGSDEYKIREYEILIGSTNRPESEKYIDGLFANDCGWTMIGDKIVIAGKTDELTILALEMFTDTILEGSFNGGVFFSADDNKRASLEYVWENSFMSFGDTDKIVLSDFTIVYNENGNANEKSLAEEFADAAEQKIPYQASVLPDTRDHGGFAEIRFNPADAPEIGELEYGVFYDGYNIIFCGQTEKALRRAMNKFIADMDAACEAESKTLMLEAEQIFTYDTTPLTAMSFNILYKFNDMTRCGRVVDIIEKYSPDTLGVQEAPAEWLSYLGKKLDSDYARVGEGRQGGTKDEYNAIFYKESLFELIDSGTKWLSDTPDKVSKYEDSACYRIFTYAHLRRKSDNSEIMVVNTHLDHVGADARKNQANVLADFLKDYSDMPLILTGDFNTTVGTAEYKNVLSGGVVSSVDIAETKSEGPTFTSFGTASGIIDFVFVTEDCIDVSSYKVCGEQIDGDYPSDHHPVLIEYTIE